MSGCLIECKWGVNGGRGGGVCMEIKLNFSGNFAKKGAE